MMRLDAANATLQNKTSRSSSQTLRNVARIPPFSVMNHALMAKNITTPILPIG